MVSTVDVVLLVTVIIPYDVLRCLIVGQPKALMVLGLLLGLSLLINVLK